MKRHIELYYSSMREGAQGEGISFSVTDKLSIIQALDLLGVPYIEAGNPVSSPKDRQLFEELKKLPLRQARVTVFGSTRHKERAAEEDEGLAALLAAGCETIAVFGKSWDMQVTEILGATLAENLAMIGDSVRYLKAQGRTVFFDAEHFFDGYRENPAYAMETLAAADAAGADRLILCDTRGGCYPDAVGEITALAAERFGDKIGVHTHNDTGCAVADALAAVSAGAVQVQGTLVGYGERAGNANLATLAADLELSEDYTCIGEERLRRLTRTVRFVAEISNVPLEHSAPYVGASAFAHKAGMHAHAVLKRHESYEHVPPEKVGNERKILMSEQTGRAAILARIAHIAPGLHKDSPEAKRIAEEVKRLELEGYSFEGAEASFELMARRMLGLYQPSFELISYYSIGEYPNKGESSTASVLIQVGEKRGGYMAKGDGPVHALDVALREALGAFFPGVGGAKLSDYKVRVLEPQAATAAKVRVLVESSDGRHRWSTVGVSTDIIRASLTALTDSFEYKLYLDASGDPGEACVPY